VSRLWSYLTGVLNEKQPPRKPSSYKEAVLPPLEYLERVLTTLEYSGVMERLFACFCVYLVDTELIGEQHNRTADSDMLVCSNIPSSPAKRAGEPQGQLSSDPSPLPNLKS